MSRHSLTKIVLAILLLAFVATAVGQVRHENQLRLEHDIELKSREAQLIELDNKYKDVLELKAETKKEKEDQAKKIRQLEKEKARLEKQLRAKQNTQSDLQRAARNASSAVSGTNTASAQSSQINGCGELRQRLSGLGVSGAELSSAITLASRESGCRSSAVNPTSGACGSFQSLPCGKWGSPGTDQYLRGAINYSKSRYGGFVGALNHSYANNWY